MYDPRINRKKQHKLLYIIILSVLAVLSGAESWDSIELFGKMNLAFLRQFIELKKGIPSHDTINRAFSLLNPRSFERLFMEWATSYLFHVTKHFIFSSPLCSNARGQAMLIRMKPSPAAP
ncbi:hypothetical protein FACS189429_4900 [Bacteroidia bacterium]|nr:hypothetical protein FACS189429_4900 [Bacteroidia bacterium]